MIKSRIQEIKELEERIERELYIEESDLIYQTERMNSKILKRTYRASKHNTLCRKIFV